jgi:hypothetical protein
MNPKQFLMLGGIIILLLGVIGFVAPNLLGKNLYFDSGENWAHTVLGVVAIIASYALGASAQRTLTGIVGIVALFFGVWGFVVGGRPAPNTFGVVNLEFLDNIVHLAVAVWAYLAMRGRPAMAGM